MKISVAQIDCVLGSIGRNIEKHNTVINRAIEEESEVIVFPELSISGYLLEDMVKDIAITQSELASLFTQSYKGVIDILVGYPEKGASGRIYNSQAVIRLENNRADIIANIRKLNLPTYGMFDESRHFRAGKDIPLFKTAKDGITSACLICEDMWHPVLPISMILDTGSIPALLFAPAASPSRGYYGRELPENLEGWEKNISFYAATLGMCILNAQRVGVEDSFIFAGGSMIAFPDGRLIKAPLFEESLITADIDIADIISRRQKTNLVSPQDIAVLRTFANGDI